MQKPSAVRMAAGAQLALSDLITDYSDDGYRNASSGMFI